MQDNTPLMRALSKLIAVNRPDLVLFVGEALVGNDAVDQLTKFNEALANHSNSKDPRLIDGIVLSKFDTIDDKGESSFHRMIIYNYIFSRCSNLNDLHNWSTDCIYRNRPNIC